MKIQLLSLLVVGANLFASQLPAAPVLAGHVGLKGQTLNADGIKAVLLGKRLTLDGVRVIIVFARSGEEQNAFLQSNVGMTTSQFQNYWRRLFMTGGGSAPKIVETEAEARKLALEIPGAVVIADSADLAGLAILSSR